MRYFVTILTLIFCILSFHPNTYGQVGSNLSGTITDTGGNVLPNIRVSLRNVNTNTQRNSATDDKGFYNITEVPPGSYELTLQCGCVGFSDVMARVQLAVGQSGVLDLSMPVAAIKAEVRVVNDPPLVDSTKAEVSQVISEKQIKDLPVSGRNFIDFVLLSPMVARGRSNRNGGAMLEPDVGAGATAVTRLSFGGQQEYFNYVAVDGLDNNQVVTRLQRATPSLEAVQEFRIVNGSYTTDYGRALGGIINVVTKSGSNNLHGSLYNFFRNDALDAHNPLANQGFDVLRQDQYGGTLSGPIRKDKTFFFVNFEGQRRAESPTYPQFVITNINAINTIKRSFGLSTENLSVLKTNDYGQIFSRVDHQFRTNHIGTLRYALLAADNKRANGDFGRNATLPSADRDNIVRDQSLSGTFTSTFGAKLVNEIRGQWARRSYEFNAVSAEPSLEIPNLLIMGRTFSPFDFYREDRVEVGDNLTHIVSSHNLKYGADFNFVKDNILFPAFASGRAIFAGLPGFLGLPPFNTPTVVAFQWMTVPAQRPPVDPDPNVAYPADWDDEARLNINHHYVGFYGQDQWRVSPRFNLTFGVRYDFELFSRRFFERDFNNIQPRVGFAISLDKSNRALIRGGGGLFYDKYSMVQATSNKIVGGRGSVPGLLPNDLDGSAFLFSLAGPPLATPAFLNLMRNGVYPAPTGAVRQIAAARTDRAQVRTPYSTQGSLQLELNVSSDTVMSLGYLAVKGTRMPRLVGNLNALPTGAIAANGTPLLAGRRDTTTYELFFPTTGSVNSIYHSGFATLTKRFTKHYGLDLSYTFSKTIDDGQGFGFGDSAQNPYDLRAERSLSGQHVAHRFVSSLLLESPFRNSLRDFKLGLSFTAESPRYYTIFVGSDVNADGNPVNDRPANNGAPLGRNSFRGDRYISLDMRLSRVFRFGERFTVEPIAEVFNLLNTFNAKDFNTVYGRPDLSLPSTGIVGFGTPRQIYNTRQVQFGFKVKF